ncbi:MAG: prohibitin 1 [Saprospiraceae bacterium]|jgi:prohibitin 1
MKQNKLFTFGIIAMIGLILVLALSSSIFLTIAPGAKGVLFKRFGGGLDKEHPYGQGFQVIAPWNEMFIYDVRTNEGLEKMTVLSKNGLQIIVELSYRYSPVPEEIGYLHNEIGANYLNRIIIPEIRSATREVIGKYLPEELYSSKREAIQDEIYQRTSENITLKHLILDAILIREVELPETLKAAIERKLKEEQSSLEYEFRLERERKESQRKVIEAQAKADANRILNASLTDKILQDKGIEATLELAKSPNSKVVIVGGQNGGLPLILNN